MSKKPRPENLKTRKEIAKIIGRIPAYVGVLINRDKKLIEENKLIDVDNRINKKYLMQFQLKDIAIEESQEKRKVKRNENGNQKEINFTNLQELDEKKKEADLELIQIKIKKENLDYLKKQGLMIEVDEAQRIMLTGGKLLTDRFRDNAKKYILNLSAKYKIPPKDMALIQKHFDSDLINKSIEEYNKLIQKECKAAAKHYSGTLLRGESKL